MLRHIAAHWLVLCLACAGGCDPNFSPDWHSASSEDATALPPAPAEAGQTPVDAGPDDAGPADASAPPDPDAASLPMYNCRIEYCDAGIPDCRTVCFAPSRELHCRPLEFCPWFGADLVDCNLCMTPPIR